MAACVTTPRQTVYSTPISVQTVLNTVTTVYTNPGPEVTQTFYYTSCLPFVEITRRRGRLMGRIECPNGTTVSTSYSTSTGPPSYITTVDITTDYVTSKGDPVAVQTQYGTSCSDTSTSSIIRTTTTTTQAQPTTSSTFSSSSFIPTPTPQPISTSSTSTSSSIDPTGTQVPDVVGHKSHKTAAVVGGIVGAIICLALACGIWFKFFKAGGGGKSGHHGHHGGEKADVDGNTGGGGGGSGGAHNVAPPGTGAETSGGAGGGGAGGGYGPAPGGAGMDGSAVAGGGYGGTAPPTTGLEGQFSNVTHIPAHHNMYPVVVPVGARRRDSAQQGPGDMVNTVSTPWVDPNAQQGYYNPYTQGPQQHGSYPQPWSNPDGAYYSSPQGGYYPNQRTSYPADPSVYPSANYPSSGPYFPNPDGAYSSSAYPSANPNNTYGSPNPSADPRTSIISHGSSSPSHPGQRASLLPYLNEGPQPGPSIPPTTMSETSTDPFDKHAEATAGPSAGGEELPPPSYAESGPSTEPFVPQDAKGRH